MTATGNRSPAPWERTAIRGLVLVSTVMLSWATLTVGAASGEVELVEGDLATRPYVAQRNSEVVDRESTRSLRDTAAEQIDGVTSRNESIEQQVSDDLSDLFAAVRRGVLGAQPVQRPLKLLLGQPAHASDIGGRDGSGPTVCGRSKR